MEDRFKMRFWLVDSKMMVYQPEEITYGEPDAAWYCKTIGRKAIQMQCTGLKDKNEFLIFEGDIVETQEQPWWNQKNKPWRYIVEWIGNENGQTGYDPFQCGDYGENSREYEIIGNIYEHPDLLNHSNE